MKPLKATLIAFVCMAGLAMQAQNPNSLSRVKIYVSPGSAERLSVISLLQLDHFQEINGAIEAEIGQRELQKLQNSGHHYQLQVADVGARLEEINRHYFEGRANGSINMDGSYVSAGRAAFEQPGGVLANIIQQPSAFVVQTGTPNLGGYYTYAQMVTAIENLYNTYSPSGIVDTFHIGLSIENRVIYAIKISDNAAADEAGEPEVFFQGIQHAREAIGGSSMIFLMQYLCQFYSTDTRIQNLVNNREIYIIVCMNPDGWEYNRSTNPNGGGGWRKNRRIIGADRGVDLNRNWSTDWGNCVTIPSSCASDDPGDDTYYGSGPFSEPETQAVRNFIKSKHIVAANDQHSVGPYYSLPFGRPTLHPAPDSLSVMQQQWYTAIPALMGKYNGMRAGNSFQALGYEVAGGVKDWMLKGEVGPGINGGEKYEILGMTGEGGYRAASSTFWPPAAEIVTLCKGMTYQNLQMIYSAGSYVDIQDNSDIAMTSLSGNLSFRIKRLGVENQPVTVTLVPIINVSSVGSPVTVTTLNNYYDTYTGNISYTLPSAMTNGQRVRFAWRVETAGYSYSDTITKFYNPTQLFFDNMESGSVGTNWVVSAGWNYVADSGYAGTRALTESPGTSYPASITTARTARYNGTFNLTTATAAYITFYTKHRAENFHDKVQLQVSTNGTTWVAIAGKTTVQEPGTLEGSTINGQPSLTGIEPDWVKELFDLSAYLGTPALRVRFAFTSDASSSFWAAQDEGFYFDDFKVIMSSTTLQILAVDFTGLQGRLVSPDEIALNWQATFNNEHSHFEIEKSADGRSFTTIGRTESNEPFAFSDRSPFSGNNYYRIKGVALNGDVKYSKIINVVNNTDQRLVFYPNPVKDELNIRINNYNGAGNMTVLVTDLSGKTVLAKQITSGNGSGTISLDVSKLAAQIYIVKLTDAANQVLDMQKLIKQ